MRKQIKQAVAVSGQTRCYFYKPPEWMFQPRDRWYRWERKLGERRKISTYQYRHVQPQRKPVPQTYQKDYFGPQTLWNLIPSREGVWHKKADQWGFPHREPPPMGLRKSNEYFPHFFDKYFPDVTCILDISSVLNVESNEVVFHFPPEMHKQEIRNYLRNIYQIDDIVSVDVRNIYGHRYKNEMGAIKMSPPFKVATVKLESPVQVELKVVKESSDAKD